METREIIRDDIAELKLVIARQQEVVSSLVRAGKKFQARRERDVLYRSLNRLDLLRAEKNEPWSAGDPSLARQGI
jgi:hypothetical protein